MDRRPNASVACDQPGRPSAAERRDQNTPSTRGDRRSRRHHGHGEKRRRRPKSAHNGTASTGLSAQSRVVLCGLINGSRLAAVMERSKRVGGVPKAPRATNRLDRRTKPYREWRELEARDLAEGVLYTGSIIMWSIRSSTACVVLPGPRESRDNKGRPENPSLPFQHSPGTMLIRMN